VKPRCCRDCHSCVLGASFALEIGVAISDAIFFKVVTFRRDCASRSIRTAFNRIDSDGTLGRTISAALIASVLMSTGPGTVRAEDPAADIRAALEQWRLDFNVGRSANIRRTFRD
jgi:hypothetical protein